jgi:Fe-S cluster assembly scaffold protein SufB
MTQIKQINPITEELLSIVSGYEGKEFDGAYNIRQDTQCAGRKSTKNIKITSRADGKSGLEVHVKPGTKGETVYIPACVSHGNVNDIVYNDFFIGEGADVTIVAGCGVHSESDEEAVHHGIHKFILEKNSKALYLEKHIGTGKGNGIHRIDPITEAELKENSFLKMDTIQLGGVDITERKTTAVVGKGAKLVVNERIMTDGDDVASTDFLVTLEGEDSGTDIVSRSVAKGNSKQEYSSRIVGKNKSMGHSACDALISDNAVVIAKPTLDALSPDAELIHEAAIGKIAGEQILKLRTLGLEQDEAERAIINGFLS